MTKATKNSLFGCKDDKRAQAQRMKREEQAKAAAEDQNKREQVIRPSEVAADFKLFVEDWESRSSGQSSSSSRDHGHDNEHNASSRNTQTSVSTRHNSPSRPATLVVPSDTEPNEVNDSVPPTDPRGRKGVVSTQFQKLKGKMTSSNEGSRPRGTEVIELESPVELERLTEFSSEPPRDGKRAERRKKNRPNKKTETVKVVIRKEGSKIGPSGG